MWKIEEHRALSMRWEGEWRCGSLEVKSGGKRGWLVETGAADRDVTGMYTDFDISPDWLMRDDGRHERLRTKPTPRIAKGLDEIAVNAMEQ
jgi:hypothetical protein